MIEVYNQGNRIKNGFTKGFVNTIKKMKCYGVTMEQGKEKVLNHLEN